MVEAGPLRGGPDRPRRHGRGDGGPDPRRDPVGLAGDRPLHRGAADAPRYDRGGLRPWQRAGRRRRRPECPERHPPGHRQVEQVVYGAVIAADGTILGEQGLALRLDSDAALDGKPASMWSIFGTYILRRGGDQGERAEIGRVVLIRKTKFLTDRVAEAALNAALAALLAVAIGIGVSLQLQRSVMRPLALLAGTMDAVRLRHDYTRRAPVTATTRSAGWPGPSTICSRP